MPSFNDIRLAAFRDVFANLSPGLSLALAEEIGQECLIEAISAENAEISALMSRNEIEVNTLFNLNEPMAGESILLASHDASMELATILAEPSGATVGYSLNDADLDRVGKALSGLVRGFAIGLTNSLGASFEVESSVTSNSLSLPPIFALNETALMINLSLTIGAKEEMPLKFIFTPDVASVMSPEIEDEVEDEAVGLSEDDLAEMLGELERAPVSQDAFSTGGNPFQSFDSHHPEVAPRGIELIMDIPLQVTVELGRVNMLIRDVLDLASGSIIELDRMAGEPVDLLVNGRLVAKGEVVVIEDNFGLRITEIVSPADRVAGLNRKKVA